MALDLFVSGVLIGRVVRCWSGCFAYSPSGAPLGEYADLDAAAAAAATRVALEPVAA
ncbi:MULTISPECIES: hypothetical protein [unclassified Methylobacterium]|uniref:hypothetical protein n=1 Tax=unclassified Methylobacterium TaxID=2615210 RepID=UPI00164EF1D3|nr:MULTISPECIES: hypothetical protein [unclassified Methylobacterium]